MLKFWILFVILKGAALTKTATESEVDCMVIHIDPEDVNITVTQLMMAKKTCIDFFWQPEKGLDTGNQSFEIFNVLTNPNSRLQYVYTVVALRHKLSDEATYPDDRDECLSRKNKVIHLASDGTFDSFCISGDYEAICGPQNSEEEPWGCTPDHPDNYDTAIAWSSHFDEMEGSLKVDLQEAAYLHIRWIQGCMTSLACDDAIDYEYYCTWANGRINTGVYIPSYFVCDGIPNCPTYSYGFTPYDESPKECPKDFHATVTPATTAPTTPGTTRPKRKSRDLTPLWIILAFFIIFIMAAVCGKISSRNEPKTSSASPEMFRSSGTIFVSTESANPGSGDQREHSAPAGYSEWLGVNPTFSEDSMNPPPSYDQVITDEKK